MGLHAGLSAQSRDKRAQGPFWGFDRNPANEIAIVNGSDFTPDRSASENPK